MSYQLAVRVIGGVVFPVDVDFYITKDKHVTKENLHLITNKHAYEALFQVQQISVAFRPDAKRNRLYYGVGFPDNSPAAVRESAKARLDGFYGVNDARILVADDVSPERALGLGSYGPPKPDGYLPPRTIFIGMFYAFYS